MATAGRKKSTSSNKNSNAKTTNAKTTSKTNKSKQQKDNTPKLTKSEQAMLDARQQKLKAEVLAISLIGVAVIIFICVIASDRMGIIGGYISAGLKHLFGIGAIILPIVFMLFGVQTLMDKTKYAYKFKLTLFIGFFTTIICLAHTFTYKQGIGDIPFSQYISDSFLNGNIQNGGFIGAIIGGAFCALLGKTGTTIILLVVSIILIVLATGKTVADIAGSIGDWIDGTKEEYRDYRLSHITVDEDEEYYDDYTETTQMELPVEKMKKKKKHKSNGKPVFINIPEDKGGNDEDIIIETDIFNKKYEYDDKEPDFVIPSFIKEDMQRYEESLKSDIIKEENFDDEDIKIPEIPTLHFTDDIKESPKYFDIYDDEYDEEPMVTTQEALEENYSEPVITEPVQETSSIINEENETPPWEDAVNNIELIEKPVENKIKENQPVIIEAEKTEEINKLNIKTTTPYKFPSPNILHRNPKKQGTSNREELINKSRLLEETLATFGVKAKVDNISQGPTVTRYELIPPKGIPVSKITKLDKDIELAMAAKSVRIEAPIPGTNKIGIELGNDSVSPVYFSEVLLTDKFRDYDSKLAFGVGKDITGTVIVADIADMTHLLIAGATGAGKSVCINTLITSILYKATPDEVKLILIDPKKVELSVYNGIPHLLIPVVSDVQKAAGALNWAIREMERRYDLLEKYGVRNIKGYNKIEGIEKLPYIVIIIDELADLMMTTGKEVENAIVRLTQLARAAGMHLVIATQRPDSNIVTGLIKANVPSRIAFKVAGSINSKIILDATGAEKLLGRGDMLLKTRAFDDKPLRIQGAFVTDEEVEDIVNSIKTDDSHYDKSVIDEINRSVAEAHGGDSDSGSNNNGSDDLIDEVIKLVAIQQKASTSFIQRKFKIGYNRAARIIDELEERGFVGPDLGGTKGREVKIDKYQYNEWKNRQDEY
ncbi:MAG: DNA translocase FtsK 4TM domain-containing protein [Eubacterium sp.]|nr:DNA translocase FtsK 4TM domain-containing protein [Eubacterium sp.]